MIQFPRQHRMRRPGSPGVTPTGGAPVGRQLKIVPGNDIRLPCIFAGSPL